MLWFEMIHDSIVALVWGFIACYLIAGLILALSRSFKLRYRIIGILMLLSIVAVYWFGAIGVIS